MEYKQISIETPSEEEKKESFTKGNILKQYEDLSPLDLVDTIERYYHTFLPSSDKDSLHILSSFKSKTNVKFQLFSFDFKKNLSATLKSKIRNITCLKIKEDNLLAGDKDGNVILYSIEKGIEIKRYVPQEKVIDFYPTSIDITPNLEFIVIGYSNGFISLWDGIKPQLIHTIRNIQKTKILVVQFCSISERKIFEFLSTDESGQLLKVILTLKFLKNSVQDLLIYKDSVPTYAMTQFKPLREKQIVLGAFGNVNKIRVYILRPVLVSFFEISRPDFIPNDFLGVPDISFGWGCPPLEFNDIGEQRKKLDEQLRENNIILAVSWGNIITLYTMKIQDEDIVLNNDGPTSYFVNNSPVIRLGFVSASIIYFFDEKGTIKIMNTAFTQYGEYNKDSSNNEYNKKALVDEGKIIDSNLISIDVSNKSNVKNYCYRYFINNMNKRIFLLTRSGFHLGKVLNFEDCIENLLQENNWFGAMCLGIDIFQGNITSFPDVPINMQDRIKFLSPYLIELLNKYIDYNLKDNKEEKEKESIEERNNRLIKCINVTIEFCIGIKDVNYLLKNVEETFKAKGKIDLFYKLLEPFIFNDLLAQEDLTEDSLIALYTTYKGNNELSLLSHIFSHFNLKCLTNSTIKKISFKEHLFSLMILIFSNSSHYEDFFLPVAKMYQSFEGKVKNKSIEFKSYFDMCGTNSIKDINNIEISTEYIGHKLLWYIDMTLKGNKFSLGMDVNFLKFDTRSEEYKCFIATLYYWILQDEIFVNLMKFDSYSFFNIMTSFVSDPYVSRIIKNYDFKKVNPTFLKKIQEESDTVFLTKKSSEINNEMSQKSLINTSRNGKEIDYNNPNSVINNIIINLVEANKSFFIELDLSLFLIKYGSKCTELEPVVGTAKKYIVQGIKRCLTFYEEYEKLKYSMSSESKDIFKCHKLDKYKEGNKIDKNNLFYKEIYKSLRDLLDSQYQLKKEELEDIISVCKNSPFTLVKIKLYELCKKYSDCLDNYLNSNEDEVFDEDVFSWLQKTFQSFSRKNKNLSEDDFKNLQKAVIDNVDKLSEKSVPKTNKIIKQFYGSKEKITIIHKLDSLPSLQYEFLRQLICPSKGGNLQELTKEKENKDEVGNENEDENKDTKNNEILCDLLVLQIDLLIKLKKENEILPSIKEQIKTYPKIYPKQKCLEKCLEYKINDASVYLYQSLGKNNEALSLTKITTEKAFDIYLEDEKEESYNYFLQQLNLCIKICQDTSESLEKEKKINKEINTKEGEKLWFDLLKSLYSFEKKSKNKKEIESKISLNIEDLLRKMCLYVSLQNIIETVTEVQKEAQYKEFKNILGDMLRSNNSFNRILKNTKLILKSSIFKYEVERNQSSIRGNCYNNKICDVCHKNFLNTKNEVLACFGCGHQSHIKCIYNSNNNNNECSICRRNEVGNDEFNKILENKTNNKNINDEKKDVNMIKDVEYGKKGSDKFIFGNRNNKIKKLKDFDKKYVEKITEIF